MKCNRLLALLLALAMVFALAACGGQSAPAKTDDGKKDASAAKSYTIGINTWGSGVPVLDMFGDAVEYTITTMGHKVNRMSDDFNADKELQNVQNGYPGGCGTPRCAPAVASSPESSSPTEGPRVKK